MKKIVCFLVLALVSVVPALAGAGEVLKSPQAGVLCDRYMCADANGVSKEMTAKYLGASTATKLFSQGAFDTTEFTFANGVFCDVKERACHNDRYFDANGGRSPMNVEATEKLFGKQM